MVYQIIQEVQANPSLADLVNSFEPNVLLCRPIKQIDSGSQTANIICRLHRKQQLYKCD